MQKQIMDLPEQQPFFVSQKKWRSRLCKSAFLHGQGRKTAVPSARGSHCRIKREKGKNTNRKSDRASGRNKDRRERKWIRDLRLSA